MYTALSTSIQGTYATSRSDACKSCGVLARNCKNKTFVSCPDPKRVESFLWDTIAFNDSIKDSDQVCYACYKFFNQMLKSDVCMLSSEDIVLELKAKKEVLEKFVHEFECPGMYRDNMQKHSL